MRRALHRLTIATDDDLIDRVRSGDHHAFGELYQRHRPAAESTAQWMLRSRAEVDDVVADAFAGVLEAIRNGNGPRDNFRSYLLATVRNGCRTRWQRMTTRSDREARLGPGDSPVFEDPERYVEADTVARAFASLNPRWQETLWLTEVEQRPAAEIAARLRLAPNATAALTHRAREAFATAYLAEHIDSAPHEACERFAPRLAAYVRAQLTDKQRDEVEQHLIDCPRCQEAVNELRDINASLRKLLPPATSVVAAQWTMGTTLTTTSGLFSSGLFLKGATALLISVPVLFNVTGGFGGGPTTEDDVQTVEAAPVSTVEDRQPIVAPRPQRPASVDAGRASAGLSESTTTTSPTVVAEPFTPLPTSRRDEPTPVTRPNGGLVPDGVEMQRNPRAEDVDDPLVEDAVRPSIDDVVVPATDEVVVPVVDEVVVSLIDVVAPVVDDVVAPIVDDAVAPVVEEVLAPVVDDVVAPVVNDVVAPVVSDVVAPVVDDVVAPVVNDVVGPIAGDVVTPLVGDVGTVVEDVVAPVVDDVLTPVVEDVVAPVVDDVLTPVVDDVVAPVVEGVVAPVVDEAILEVLPTLPHVTVPEVTVPLVIAPPETIAPVMFPTTTTAVPVTLPAATVPTTTTAPSTTAPVTVPLVTVPPATATPVTVSSSTLPLVTVPSVTLPPVIASLPPEPGTTEPGTTTTEAPATVPSVTVPGLVG